MEKVTSNLDNEKRARNARRWYRTFLVVGIVGIINTITPSSIVKGIGSIAALFGYFFGGYVAVVVNSICELGIIWIILALLLRRKMKKLSNE